MDYSEITPLMPTTTPILQEFIEAVNRPDWWTIGITMVNALIMFWLGWRQYQQQKQQTQLQERQTKQQEYEVYRRLYHLIRRINATVQECIPNTIYGFLSEPIYNVYNNDYWGKQIDKIQDLKMELAECRVDFELKLSHNCLDIEKYEQLLESINSTLLYFNILYIEKIAVVRSDNEKMVWEHCATNESSTNNVIEKIIAHISYDYKQEIRTRLLDLNSAIETGLAMNIIEKILDAMGAKTIPNKT